MNSPYMNFDIFYIYNFLAILKHLVNPYISDTDMHCEKVLSVFRLIKVETYINM